MTESKAERFQRIGEQRVRGVMEAVRKLGNLSNTSYYDFDAADVERMFSDIDAEMARAKSRFEEALGRGAR